MRFFSLFAFSLTVLAATLPAAETEPLFDWSAWGKHRDAVQHPSGAIKAADVARARENLRHYPWAQSYLASLEKTARAALGTLTDTYLEAMIPETTPGDAKFTPCPACRDLGKPVHPHGLWSWSATAPDQLRCEMCRTVFPNEKYPETIALEATWKRQTLTFCGGEPFVVFGYKTGRPSFSGNIRARKVAHLASVGRSLAEAYLLTGKFEYAAAVRRILLRFAACYPGWLVHVGYGEYADMDPRSAAQFISALPAPELCPPPNKPDRKLYTGYWTAGRASGVGQESGFVRKVVEAYDFTCTAKSADGTPLYADAERRTIERDLLLESTLLLVADKAINNKSVGNRTATALVGLCVGHPGLVRFGADGFQKTIDEWFLPDGTTSESPAYATMTLGGIWDMAQALRGYVDPAGGGVAADVYHGTAYERVWQNMFNGLQGDLKYPAYADSYRTSGLGDNFVELMAANYPERPEYLSLLKELCGRDLSRAYAPVALYYRQPGLEQRASPVLALPDFCPPELRVGHLRTGADGRESLVLLSASHWGNHHHEDSLNLTYWKRGAELLSDLGYLWDHPKKHQAARTVAHNTVLIDEKDQATKTRGGEVVFFRTSEHVKVMRARSRAYPDASTYERTTALIDHGGGRSYVVDFFRVEGGTTQDYVFHGAAAGCEIFDAAAKSTAEKFYDFTNARSLTSDARAWRATWQASPTLTCVAWNVPQAGERAFVADGWGQRDWKNSDIGATLPYIIRRTTGGGVKTFVSVFEGVEGHEAVVRSVTTDLGHQRLQIETSDGTDVITSQPNAAGFEAKSIRGGIVAWEFKTP